ncbi:Delta8-fatty-acid desaturase [Hondaea fermentalgiana]|uniref:Delta8-fatty-acid desaturase n=1 Tax=Hondaea fermentalgiana TaxID=2315210 RepID=A0A2R5GM45_9STRA|nr:Delta8-fatty-acid desaturase [Hondaea fermentalgiana]|eukprot:GBG29703.1 Delta8-fatty-acid desaturase [Hondaea fermentalgiana]
MSAAMEALANVTNGTAAGAGPEAAEAAHIVAVAVMAVVFVASLLGQMFVYNQTPPSEYTAREPVSPGEGMVWREEGGKAVAKPKEAPVYARKRKELSNKVFSWDEVKQHCARDDLWVVIENKVFNVTPYVERHPGGWRPMVHTTGKDGTDAFTEFHPASIIERWLPQYYIGDIEETPVPPLVRDFRAIRQGLLARGFFENTSDYYMAKYIWFGSLFAPALYGVLFCSSFSAHMVSAVFMAMFWQQMAFVGHDAGHNAVSHHRDTDLFWAGFIGDMLGGVGLSWWKLSHNTHHCVTNSVENDPDIQHLPFLAITSKLFKRFYSTFHDRFFEADFFSRFFVGYQHILYYPVMMVARFNLIVQSWLTLLSKERCDFRYSEMIALAIFWVWFGFFVSALPANERIPYVVLSYAVAGILHVQICISHFMMETYHGKNTDNWIEHQLRTSQDVTCPLYMDWFHGGLQFQIEHHLWPRLPRRNLRVARKLLIELCAKHNLNYVEMDFIESNKHLIRCLQKTAVEARKLDSGDAGFFESPIWESLHLRG